MLLRTEFKNHRNKIGNNNDNHCEFVINKKKFWVRNMTNVKVSRSQEH